MIKSVIDHAKTYFKLKHKNKSILWFVFFFIEKRNKGRMKFLKMYIRKGCWVFRLGHIFLGLFFFLSLSFSSLWFFCTDHNLTLSWSNLWEMTRIFSFPPSWILSKHTSYSTLRCLKVNRNILSNPFNIVLKVAVVKGSFFFHFYTFLQQTF